MKLIPRLSWPLLGKELVEQAARKRTYVVRVVYAAALIGIFLLFFHQMMTHYQSSGMLGQGRVFFNCILTCQSVGVLLFLPAMMAGVITSEKERGSLELLFLTDLKPWEMIWQKYLGRLIPMFSFLLISLPLLAVAYAFGGVDKQQLIDGILMLFLTCLQLGAFSLVCSAYCRTTTGAVLASYLLGALFYIFLPLVDIISDGKISGKGNKWVFILCPPTEYVSLGSFGTAGIIVALVTTGLFLLGARLFFTRRAFVPPKNILLRWFKKLDGFFKAKNQLIGGIVFFAKPDSLPDDQPVAWRELERRSLGQWNYLVRIFVVLEAATVFLCLLFWKGMNSDVFLVVLMVLWVAATLTLSVQAVTVISSERTNQTLETLLTTPLRGSDILRQKMRGLYRLMFLFGIPMLTIVGAAFLFASTKLVRNQFVTAPLSIIIYMIIYLPLITWVSLWISLKCRKRNQAILIVLGVLLLWFVGPLLAELILELFNMDGQHGRLIVLLSPACVVWLTLYKEWDKLNATEYSTLAMILTFGFYIVVLYSARAACLRRADRYLRGETTSVK